VLCRRALAIRTAVVDAAAAQGPEHQTAIQLELASSLGNLAALLQRKKCACVCLCPRLRITILGIFGRPGMRRHRAALRVTSRAACWIRGELRDAEDLAGRAGNHWRRSSTPSARCPSRSCFWGPTIRTWPRRPTTWASCSSCRAAPWRPRSTTSTRCACGARSWARHTRTWPWRCSTSASSRRRSARCATLWPGTALRFA